MELERKKMMKWRSKSGIACSCFIYGNDTNLCNISSTSFSRFSPADLLPKKYNKTSISAMGYFIADPAIGGLDDQHIMAERPPSFGPVSSEARPTIPFGLQRDPDRRNKVRISLVLISDILTPIEQLVGFSTITTTKYIEEGNDGVVQVAVRTHFPHHHAFTHRSTVGPSPRQRHRQWVRRPSTFEEGT